MDILGYFGFMNNTSEKRKTKTLEEHHTFISDMSDFFAASENNFQILEERFPDFLFYS